MFRGWIFRAANATHLLVGGALIIGMVTIPLMANTVLGLSPLEGGLMLMRLTAGIPVGALIGGIACRRLGYRTPTIVGLALAGLQLPFALPGETPEQSQQRVLEFQGQVNDAGLTLFNDFFLVAMGVCLVALLPAALMGWRRARQ